MSTSTNGILVYGYIWSDIVDILEGARSGEDGDLEWAKIIAARRGVANPWNNYPAANERLPYKEREVASQRWIAEHRTEIDARHEAIKAIEAEFGVSIEHHGSDSWACPIVCITGVGSTAYRGYPKQIDPASLEVGPDWASKLAAFVAELGIDTSEAEGPGWFLASWWG